MNVSLPSSRRPGRRRPVDQGVHQLLEVSDTVAAAMVLGTLRQRCQASSQWHRQRQEDRADSEQRRAPEVDDDV